MTWTVYTFGDGDLVADILNGVKLLMGGGVGSLSTAVSLAGLAVLFSRLTFGSAAASSGVQLWTSVLQWFFGLVIVLYGLLMITVTVTTEDVVDGRIPPEVVTDIPLAVALPASVSSEISYQLTRAATSLSLGGSMGDVGTTVAKPVIALSALLAAELPEGDLHANLVNYLHFCVLPEIGASLSAQTLDLATDLLQAIYVANPALSLAVIQNGQEQPSQSCPDFYNSVLVPSMSYTADSGYAKAANDITCQLIGGRGLASANGVCSPTQPSWSDLGDGLQTLQLGIAGSAPETVFRNVIITKAWPEAEFYQAKDQNDLAYVTKLSMDRQTQEQQLAMAAGNSISRRGLLRQIRSLADGFVYLSSPLLMVAALTPAIFSILGLYVRLYLWLMLWGPLTAIANYVILMTGISDITAAATQANTASAIVKANVWPLWYASAQLGAAATDIMLSVPVIALGLAWGSASALGSTIGGAAQRAEGQMTEVMSRGMSGEAIGAAERHQRIVDGRISTAIERGGLSGSAGVVLGTGDTISAGREGSVRVHGVHGEALYDATGAMRSGDRLVPGPAGQERWRALGDGLLEHQFAGSDGFQITATHRAESPERTGTGTLISKVGLRTTADGAMIKAIYDGDQIKTLNMEKQAGPYGGQTRLHARYDPGSQRYVGTATESGGRGTIDALDQRGSPTKAEGLFDSIQYKVEGTDLQEVLSSDAWQPTRVEVTRRDAQGQVTTEQFLSDPLKDESLRLAYQQTKPVADLADASMALPTGPGRGHISVLTTLGDGRQLVQGRLLNLTTGDTETGMGILNPTTKSLDPITGAWTVERGTKGTRQGETFTAEDKDYFYSTVAGETAFHQGPGGRQGVEFRGQILRVNKQNPGDAMLVAGTLSGVRSAAQSSVLQETTFAQSNRGYEHGDHADATMSSRREAQTTPNTAWQMAVEGKGLAEDVLRQGTNANRHKVMLAQATALQEAINQRIKASGDVTSSLAVSTQLSASLGFKVAGSGGSVGSEIAGRKSFTEAQQADMIRRTIEQRQHQAWSAADAEVEREAQRAGGTLTQIQRDHIWEKGFTSQYNQSFQALTRGVDKALEQADPRTFGADKAILLRNGHKK